MKSVFLTEHYITDPKTSHSYWKKGYAIYYDNFTNFPLENDWRFSEVKDKRKLAIFLGTVNNLIFPIKFPLKLNNGLIINEL